MKKPIFILLAALGILTSACATYTCPTYAKAPVEKEKEVRVEERN